MDFTVTEDASHLLLTINGPMELHTVKELQNKIIELNSAVNKDIIIDLSSVDYIDSTGISILIMLNRQQKQKGKGLKIRNATPRVSNLLDLSSLSELLHL
jgi:anti-sigma B factor antagonist